MLPRAKSHRICVADHSYRYLVTETDTKNEVVSLAITVQHAEVNGARLRVVGLTTRRVPEEHSKFYMGRTVDTAVKPRHVAKLIALATTKGWMSDVPGPPFTLRMRNADVFASDK